MILSVVGMENEKNSLIKLFWIFLSVFLVLIILSISEWMYINIRIYNYIKITFLIVGITISAIIVEYIIQYNIFENKGELSNIGINIIYLAIGYIIFSPITFGNKLIMIVTILIIICLLRHNDYLNFKNILKK